MRLTEMAHAAIRVGLTVGDVTIDATVGNGHDAIFLAGIVGPLGRVFCFDVQPEAIERTAAAAAAAAAAGHRNITLFLANHSKLAAAIPRDFHGRVGAAMFNLGYLPGGDKRVTTTPASTVAALAAALQVLRPGGVLTAITYRGHPRGAEEHAAVDGLIRGLCDDQFERRDPVRPGGPSSPTLYVVWKRGHQESAVSDSGR